MREPGWITKAEAATLLDCDERTIERRARAGRIASKGKPGFQTLYLAADVEKLQQAGSGEVRTGILEPGPAGNGNGNGSHRAIARVSTADEDPIRQLAALVVQALTAGPIGPTGPTDAPTGPTLAEKVTENPFLTIAEAAAYVRLPAVDIRRACESGELTARKTSRGGWRIRRRDVEAL